MPQFDISAFIVQLIWLFVALMSFYLLLCLYFLPVTSQYIKARKSIYFTLKTCIYPLLNLCKSGTIAINFKKKVIF